jgi:hypothetical protein
MHRSRILRSLGISRATKKHILESLLGERGSPVRTLSLLSISEPLNHIESPTTTFHPSLQFSPLLSSSRVSHHLVSSFHLSSPLCAGVEDDAVGDDINTARRLVSQVTQLPPSVFCCAVAPDFCKIRPYNIPYCTPNDTLSHYLPYSLLSLSPPPSSSSTFLTGSLCC